MTEFDDTELYRRGIATLVASWEAYAHGLPDASVRRLPGVSCAVFPSGPERDVYNNAVLDRGLSAAARTATVDAMAAAYAEAGVRPFAAWVHERDIGTRDELERRGYAPDTATRAMGMALDGIRLPRPELELGALDWAEYLRLFGLPPGLLERSDRSAIRLVVARLDGEAVASALAFDHDGDCGIYNVATREHARRRGLGTALTTLLLHDAKARDCRTASLQSTPMAERVYAAVGFRDLGRIIEYVPGDPASRR